MLRASAGGMSAMAAAVQDTSVGVSAEGVAEEWGQDFPVATRI